MTGTSQRSEHRSTGFTMMEILIALVISSFLVTIVLQIVKNQGDLSRMLNARQEIQQNSRSSMELIASELRAVPGSAIVVAQPTEIGFWVPRAWGLVCPGAAVGTVWVSFPQASFIPAAVPLGNMSGDPWGLGVQAPTLTPQTFTTGEVTAVADEAGRCAELRVDGTEGVVFRKFSHSSATVPADSTRAYVARYAAYRVGASPSTKTADQWLQRLTSTSLSAVPQPMAGPLAADGLSFTYYCRSTANPDVLVAMTTAQLAAPTTPAIASRIQAVKLKMIMRSSSKIGTAYDSKTDSMTINLRNTSPGATCP